MIGLQLASLLITQISMYSWLANTQRASIWLVNRWTSSITLLVSQDSNLLLIGQLMLKFQYTIGYPILISFTGLVISSSNLNILLVRQKKFKKKNNFEYEQSSLLPSRRIITTNRLLLATSVVPNWLSGTKQYPAQSVFEASWNTAIQRWTKRMAFSQESFCLAQT